MQPYVCAPSFSQPTMHNILVEHKYTPMPTVTQHHHCLKHTQRSKFQCQLVLDSSHLKVLKVIKGVGSEYVTEHYSLERISQEFRTTHFGSYFGSD